MQCNACPSVAPDAITSDSDDVHPLLRAIVSYDAAAVQELLSKDPQAVNTRFEDSLTPLMHAVVAGDEAIVDLLLQHGADPSATTEDRIYGEGGGYKLCVVGGRTLLHLAHAHGRTELLPKFESLGVASRPDFNGDLPSAALAQQRDDCAAVRERMLKSKHAASPEKDQQLTDMLGIDLRQVLLPAEEWQTRKICDGVVMLKCFNDDARARVSRLITQVSEGGGDAANTMSRYGLRLRDTAVDYLISRNLDAINEMISRSFSESTAPTVMKDHYTFAIRYAVGGDESLGTHSDRSAFTLNICLAASCEGSEVYFVNDEREVTEVKHEPGWALLHLGGIRHGTRQLKSGTRENLVVWLYG